MARLLASFAVVLPFAIVVAAQAADPLSGIWELNVTKTKFSPPSAGLKSQTRNYQVKGDREIAHHTGVDAQGQPVTVNFTITYDGKDHPYKGPDWDALAVRRVDAYTTSFTQSRGGKVVLSGMRTVSKDGRTLTITSKGTNAKGEQLDHVMVFDKR
jgi:hypothetical protein